MCFSGLSLVRVNECHLSNPKSFAVTGCCCINKVLLAFALGSSKAVSYLHKSFCSVGTNLCGIYHNKSLEFGKTALLPKYITHLKYKNHPRFLL